MHPVSSNSSSRRSRGEEFVEKREGRIDVLVERDWEKGVRKKKDRMKGNQFELSGIEETKWRRRKRRIERRIENICPWKEWRERSGGEKGDSIKGGKEEKKVKKRNIRKKERKF